MNRCIDQAEDRLRRMQSIIRTLQFLNSDVDLHEERYELLEMLNEMLPTVRQIRLYMTIDAQKGKDPVP